MATKATKKLRYKVTNWKEYNEALVNRGDITLWFSEEAIAEWEHANEGTKVGRPFLYSDTAIECLLILREFFHLPYRQTEGFGKALVKLMRIDVPIPDYSSLAKRAAKLGVTLDVKRTQGAIDIVIDSTGLKIYGAGEWRSQAYGKAKRRTWRKLHLSIDPETQEIVAVSLTSRSRADADEVPALLDQVDQEIKKIFADGAYDTWKLHEILQTRGIQPVIPPARNAAIKQHGNCAADPLPRDEAVRKIRHRGRSRWKEEVGYHQRSLVETAMFRIKKIFGNRLKNKNFENQKIEARLKCKILNRFTQLGMTQFQWN